MQDEKPVFWASASKFCSSTKHPKVLGNGKTISVCGHYLPPSLLLSWTVEDRLSTGFGLIRFLIGPVVSVEMKPRKQSRGGPALSLATDANRGKALWNKAIRQRQDRGGGGGGSHCCPLGSTGSVPGSVRIKPVVLTYVDQESESHLRLGN